MVKPLAPYAGSAYALLRIVTGLLFAFHGMQKVFGWMAEDQPHSPLLSQVGIGGVLELVCGMLIAVGFFASFAAFVASGEMAVAYIQFHWKLQFDRNFFPAINHGELAVVYCFVFLFIACNGVSLHGAGAAPQKH